MNKQVVLGKVVGTRDHADYLVAVYREGEIDSPPSQLDCAIGTFVRIGKGNQGIVGIIISSQLLSDVGTGIHFSPVEDLEFFSPELLDGSALILTVHGIGLLGDNGQQETGIPSISPSIHDPVIVLNPDEIKRFHLKDDHLDLGYIPLLNIGNDVGTRVAILRALKKLSSLLPEHEEVIELILKEIEWGHQVNF